MTSTISSVVLLLLSLLLLLLQPSNSIECIVGYGQRGKLYSNGLSWQRNCPDTKYCFEVVTDDINKMIRMIDFPWDPYFYEFYIRSCGGDFNTTADWHPYREVRKTKGRKAYRAVRRNSRLIKLNITMRRPVTREGGTEEFLLNYICRDNMCSSAPSFSSISMWGVGLATALGLLLTHILI